MRRRRRRTWRFRDSWLGRWWERRFCIREKYCSQCNQPYVTSPEAKPEEQFVSCSSAALVYPFRRGSRKDYRVRLGRWQPHRNRLELAQLFEADDLDDLLKAVSTAKRYVDAARRKQRAQQQREQQRSTQR